MSKKTRKKPTSKKSKKNQAISKAKLLNIFLLIFLFAFIASTTSYFIMKSENPNKSITNNILKDSTKALSEDTNELKEFQKKKLDEYFTTIETPKDAFEEYSEEHTKDYDEDSILPAFIPNEEKRVQEIKKATPPSTQNPKTESKKEIKKEVVHKTKEIKEIKKELEKKIVKTTPIKVDKVDKKETYKYNKKTKPKIVILIDDVSTKRQKRNILNVGYTINMAFLPPTKGHPNSSKIAQNLPFHMIHFPMQASSKFKGAEIDTLNVGDSYEKIEKRVKQLREWFPKAKYTNNHTGSVFTQNYEAMDRLFRALKKYNFIFVDSRTTAKSKAKIMAKKYGMPYIVRNTFMDNKKDYKYIQNQLKKAIKIAKKRGYAIAIGHPYPITIKVLKESKHLLKGLEPVYLKDLPYL